MLSDVRIPATALGVHLMDQPCQTFLFSAAFPLAFSAAVEVTGLLCSRFSLFANIMSLTTPQSYTPPWPIFNSAERHISEFAELQLPPSLSLSFMSSCLHTLVHNCIRAADRIPESAAPVKAPPTPLRTTLQVRVVVRVRPQPPSSVSQDIF